MFHLRSTNSATDYEPDLHSHVTTKLNSAATTVVDIQTCCVKLQSLIQSHTTGVQWVSFEAEYNSTVVAVVKHLGFISR